MSSASIAAGLYSGLQSFLDAAAFATVVFGPAGLPLDIGIQHALLGYVLMQVVSTMMSRAGSIVTPVSYEVMPFLARFAAGTAKTVPAASLLPTVLAGSMLVSACAGVACALLSALPLGGSLERLLPPALQAGLFSAIGWGLYTLSFETLGLEGLPLDASVGTWATARLWLPAHVLGLGLWLASRRTSSPALFPGFIGGVTLLTHAVRLATGTTLEQAQADHWLMASTDGRPCTTLWAAAYDWGSVEWGALLAPAAAKQLVCAVLFGPLINTLLNLVLIGPVIEQSVSLPAELRAHAAGAAASALGGGYSSYIAVSNTAIHRKCGGRDRLSCYAAAALALTFLVVHPLFAIVGYVPTLAIAAICVYIGVDFLWDNLVEAYAANGLLANAGSWLVLALCLQYDMLVGVVVGVTLFQVAAYVAVDEKKKAKGPAKAAAAKRSPAKKSPSPKRSPPKKSPAAKAKSPAKPKASPRAAKSPARSPSRTRPARLARSPRSSKRQAA